MSKILRTTLLSKHTEQDWPWGLAFGILAAAAGITAGGHPLPILAVCAAAVSFYLIAEQRGWLLKAGSDQRVRNSAVAVVFALLATCFVAATGGASSHLICSLYLPIFLVTVCYGLRLGLLTGLGMAAACTLCVLGGFHRPQTIAVSAIAIGLSFPLAAIFGGVLRAQMEERLRVLRTQMEERLRVLRTEKDDLSALLDMSQMMESAFDLDMTLNLILLNLQEHSGCQTCAVYLKDAEDHSLKLRAASGPRDRVSLLPSFLMQDARVGEWSLSAPLHGDNVQAFYAPDSLQNRVPHLSRLFEIDQTARSFACLPLDGLPIDGMEGLIGMLYVGYRQPRGLTPDGVRRLEHFATRTAFPLQRVLVQQDFRSLAYSDSMTGLDNFRQFEETLTAEMSRAERYDRPLSVILLDIDHFKLFNDTLGHQAGDALLGQLGVVLRNSLRNVDKPARYGGEEFVVICPETGPEEARLIAERIRRNVAETQFSLLDKGMDDGERGAPQVTVSLGCATFPRDARTSRDLVKKADTALYAAKEAGRNAVRAYDNDPMTASAV